MMKRDFSDFIAPKKPTVEEELGDLRQQLRILQLRMERMEEHTHGPDGNY